MDQKPLRIYADSSVFGGVFDDEFCRASRALFDAIRAGVFRLVTSETVREEIAEAPPAVQDFFQQMARDAEIVPITEDALRLRDAYHEAGILSTNWSEDALHVALATAARCDAIVSWNFKHIVHFQKIPMYNAVNTLRGFGPIRIHSPWRWPLMATKTKTFDCVEMKRRGAEKIRRRLRGMTREEVLAYWARGTAEFIDLQETLRKGKEGVPARDRSQADD